MVGAQSDFCLKFSLAHGKSAFLLRSIGLETSGDPSACYPLLVSRSVTILDVTADLPGGLYVLFASSLMDGRQVPNYETPT